MNYFRSLTQSELINMILATQEELYICIPSLHIELVKAINEMAGKKSYFEDKQIEIHILIDFDPQTFRQGYGEFSAFESLFLAYYDINNLKDNRISFIISDNNGYYLFTESRSLIPSDKETINAVKIDPVSIVRLKQHFFPETVKDSLTDDLSNAIIEESKYLSDPLKLLPEKSAPVNEITLEDYNYVKTDLEKNPPIHPDYKRTVEFYSNKFQYAELHFEGQNFRHASVKIPPNLLPYKNKEIREKMITKLKLFEKIAEKEGYLEFSDLEFKKKQISERYLTPLKSRRNKSILKKTDKDNFKKEVLALEDDVNSIKNSLIKTMNEEIVSAKSELFTTLKQFLIENPTEEMISKGSENYPLIANNITILLMRKLNIPDPSSLIKGFKIEMEFSDIVFEDLKDVKLLKELREKLLIDEEDSKFLADFGKGIQIF